MTEYMLFPGAAPDPSDAPTDAINLGVEFYVTSAVRAVGIRFLRNKTSIIGPITGRLYTVDSATTGTPVPGTDVTLTYGSTVPVWLRSDFASPVPLVANQRYRAVIHLPNASRFPRTPEYWNTGAGSAGITQGPLRAPNAAGATGADQCSFVSGTSFAFPTGSFQNTNYYVDLVVDDALGGGGEESPWSLWDGAGEMPLTLDGVWDGSTIQPLTFDQVT